MSSTASPNKPRGKNRKRRNQNKENIENRPTGNKRGPRNNDFGSRYPGIDQVREMNATQLKEKIQELVQNPVKEPLRSDMELERKKLDDVIREKEIASAELKLKIDQKKELRNDALENQKNLFQNAQNTREKFQEIQSIRKKREALTTKLDHKGQQRFKSVKDLDKKLANLERKIAHGNIRPGQEKKTEQRRREFLQMRERLVQQEEAANSRRIAAEKAIASQPEQLGNESEAKETMDLAFEDYKRARESATQLKKEIDALKYKRSEIFREIRESRESRDALYNNFQNQEQRYIKYQKSLNLLQRTYKQKFESSSIENAEYTDRQNVSQKSALSPQSNQGTNGTKRRKRRRSRKKKTKNNETNVPASSSAVKSAASQEPSNVDANGV